MWILAELPDIEDISLPEPVPSPWPWMIGIAVALVLIGGVTWTLVHFLRKDAKRAVPPVLPHLQALRELERLQEHADDYTPNQFSQAVSQSLEIYLESKFGDSSRYETAEELIYRLGSAASTAVPVGKREQLVEFASIAEEIKFGLPPHAEASKLPLLEKARSIITT